MKLLKGLSSVCILSLVGGSFVFAADSGVAHPYLTDRFFVDVGVYFPERELRISVDGPETGQGATVNVNNDLNLGASDETAALNFGWRFSEHWKFSAQYFKSSDNFSATLDEDIEWGDDVFPIGGEVFGGQEFGLVRTVVGYEFNESDKHAFGIGAGLHWLAIDVFIEGDLLLGGPVGIPIEERRKVDVAGILPNIGFWYRYSLTPKWVLTARYDWLSARIDEYDGRLVNASAGMNYQLFEHLGVGINYNFFELDVGVSSDNWVGSALTSYDGIYMYLSAYW